MFTAKWPIPLVSVVPFPILPIWSLFELVSSSNSQRSSGYEGWVGPVRGEGDRTGLIK